MRPRRRARASAPVRGLLRITAPVQFGRRHIAPIVARFLDAHDGVEVELLLNDRNIDLIEEGDRCRAAHRPAGQFDPVGAAGRACAPAVGGEPGLSQAPRHAARRRPIWRATRRSSAPCAATASGFRRRPPRRAPRLNGRLRVDDVETRLRAAREGRGIAQLLSYQVADELAAGKLVRLLQRLGARRRCRCISSPRAAPIARPRSMPSSTSRPGASWPCRCCPKQAAHPLEPDGNGVPQGMPRWPGSERWRRRRTPPVAAAGDESARSAPNAAGAKA